MILYPKIYIYFSPHMPPKSPQVHTDTFILICFQPQSLTLNTKAELGGSMKVSCCVRIVTFLLSVISSGSF